jgi:hypothetical protein
MSTEPAFTLIKLAHTVIWAVMAVAIVAVPIAALRGRFRLAGWLTALVAAECIVLALNGGRCPLTDLAARFTTDRAANFDIYLPLWLAANNKAIFGGLFLLGELVCLWRWMKSRSVANRRSLDSGPERSARPRSG